MAILPAIITVKRLEFWATGNGHVEQFHCEGGAGRRC